MAVIACDHSWILITYNLKVMVFLPCTVFDVNPFIFYIFQFDYQFFLNDLILTKKQ